MITDVRGFEPQSGGVFLNLLTTQRKYEYIMKKGSGSKSTIIIGPSNSVLVYALHSLEYVLGLARFRLFVPKLLLLWFFLAFYTDLDKI